MKRIAFLVLILCFAIPVRSQVRNEADPDAHIIVTRQQIDFVVETSRNLATTLPALATDVTVKYLPSGKTIQFSVNPTNGEPLHLTPGSFQQFSWGVVRTDAMVPEKGDTSFEVEVRNLRYEGSTETLKVKGIVYDSSNIKNLVKATSDALAPTKTTEEKDLFAGLNIGVPSTNGVVQGDIVINRTIESLPSRLRLSFADSGSFGLKLKKGSDDGKDPRHFELGFNFRKTKLRANEAELAAVRNAIDGESEVSGAALNDANDALKSIRSRFFRAYLVDYGLQMEADVSQKGLGNVSNAVGDFRFQLATAAMGFLGEKGFITLRFMPAGFDLGYNVANPDKKTQEVGSVSRFKGGGELKIYYQNDEADSPVQRVELNLANVYRRLLQDELAYDATTKTNIVSKRRDMTWTQLDFKVLLGARVGSLRPGLKATYQRGYLPPVFARTKVFTYGFVLESVN